MEQKYSSGGYSKIFYITVKHIAIFVEGTLFYMQLLIVVSLYINYYNKLYLPKAQLDFCMSFTPCVMVKMN